MEFNNENDFGIQSVESVGSPMLFASDPEEITAIVETPEGQEEKPKEEGFELDNGSPMLFEDEPKTKEEKPKEEEKIVGTSDPKIEEKKEEIVEEVNNIPIYYETLLEQGLIAGLEEGEEAPQTPEELLAKFQLQGQAIANQTINGILGQYGQDRIDFFNAVFVNGVDPKDYFKVEQKLNSVKNIDLSTIENQEQVISQYYKGIGWTSEKIKKHLKRLEEDGETEAEATDSYNNLVQKEELELQQLVAQQAHTARLKEQEKLYYNQQISTILVDKLKNKEFDGIPVTEKVARETNEFLTVHKWELPTGEKLTDFDKWLMDLNRPENYEQKVKIALLHRTGFDFEKIKKKAISTESNKLFQGLQNKEKEKKTNQSQELKVQGFSL